MLRPEASVRGWNQTLQIDRHNQQNGNGGLFLITVWRVWFENVGGNLTALKLLPPWPLSADKNAGPGSVVGEVYHPVKAVESRNPRWLVIPERGRVR